MIVQCIEIYNDHVKKYIDLPTDGFITKGFHYNVLEILFAADCVYYRILADDSGMHGHPIIVRSQDFKVISYKYPPSWIMYKRDGELLGISPESWTQDEIWTYSFWEEFGNVTPKSIKCLKDEVKVILNTDKDYISQMVNERKDFSMLINWHETMIPLFKEIQHKEHERRENKS